MTGPASAIVQAAADVSAMGNKAAGFVIAQNFLWTFAAIKGDLNPWLSHRRNWFFYCALGSGFVYAFIEAILGWYADSLVQNAGYEHDTMIHVIKASHVQFTMLALGAFTSSMLAGLAFWGTGRDALVVNRGTKGA